MIFITWNTKKILKFLRTGRLLEIISMPKIKKFSLPVLYQDENNHLDQNNGVEHLQWHRKLRLILLPEYWSLITILSVIMSFCLFICAFSYLESMDRNEVNYWKNKWYLSWSTWLSEEQFKNNIIRGVCSKISDIYE